MTKLTKTMNKAAATSRAARDIVQGTRRRKTASRKAWLRLVGFNESMDASGVAVTLYISELRAAVEAFALDHVPAWSSHFRHMPPSEDKDAQVLVTQMLWGDRRHVAARCATSAPLIRR